MRKSELLHCPTGSQKCCSDEDSQCWVNPSPHSTTSVYKEIIVMFNTPNTAFLAFFRVQFHHSSSSRACYYVYIFFGQHIPIFSWYQKKLLEMLQKSSYIIIIWCITAACLRIFIFQSRFESAVFPGAKFKITDEAIFQNAIFP